MRQSDGEGQLHSSTKAEQILCPCQPWFLPLHYGERGRGHPSTLPSEPLMVLLPACYQESKPHCHNLASNVPYPSDVEGQEEARRGRLSGGQCLESSQACSGLQPTRYRQEWSWDRRAAVGRSTRAWLWPSLAPDLQAPQLEAQLLHKSTSPQTGPGAQTEHPTLLPPPLP